MDQLAKREHGKTVLTANGVLTYYTADAVRAQVTISKEAGSPDGTITIHTKPSKTGAATLVSTYATPSATKTFTGEAQNVLTVTLATHTTGSVGVEVVTW